MLRWFAGHHRHAWESDLSPSSFLSEIRLGLRAAYHGLWGRTEVVAAVPNDRGMALRSFLGPVLASPWFFFERWMAYRLPVWLYIPYNPPRLIFLEIIYELQSWVMFPLVVFALTSVLGGRQNFWRFWTLTNWAMLVLLPFTILISLQDWVLVGGSGLVLMVTSLIVAAIVLVASYRLLKLSLDVTWGRAALMFAVGILVSVTMDQILPGILGLPSESLFYD